MVSSKTLNNGLELVRHLLKVVDAHPNYSNNHLFVIFLSARTTLILFSIHIL